MKIEHTLLSNFNLNVLSLTAPFNSIHTLNFKTQLTICVFYCHSYYSDNQMTIRIQKLAKWIKIIQLQCLNLAFLTRLSHVTLVS